MLCFFLASKVENDPANLTDLLKKVPNPPKKTVLVPLENSLCDALQYDFKIKHVDVALDGAWMSLEMPLAEPIYTLARQFAVESYQTDALFLFWPSIIAWSCLSISAKKSGIEIPNALLSCVTYLEKQGIGSTGPRVVPKTYAKECADKLLHIKLPELDPASYTSRKRHREEEEAQMVMQRIRLTKKLDSDVMT